MIILDLNQIMFSTVLQNVIIKKEDKINEDLVRHIALNIIRSIRSKFKSQYGELVIASDSPKYWRREFFPYYKANRKKNREKSNLDWTSIFNCMNTLKAELREFFPYKYIEVDGAEADDIIATLVEQNQDDDILIISGDKDFAQLQKHDNVKQYDFINKKYIKATDPLQALHDHILKGDVGDGIPNIASSDNCLVLGERQKKITKNLCPDIALNHEHKLYRNYIRNKTLIDLDMIPKDIKENIINAYENNKSGNRSFLLNYFIQHKLKNLMEQIGEF